MDETAARQKATIKHKLTLCKASTEFKLLWHCALRDILLVTPADQRLARLSKIYLLQSAYRSQMYRLITQEPANALKYTYQLNCRPAGVLVKPATKFCMQPKKCPWCFARQLRVIYNALCAVPAYAQDRFKFVGWSRVLPFTPNGTLPFFSSKYGPHQWCDAAVTVQAIVPGLRQTGADTELVFRHVGLQQVPVSFDPVESLPKKFRRVAADFTIFQPKPESPLSPALQMMTAGFKFDWSCLFQPAQLPLFQALNADFKKQRFVRINKFKGV